jgi:acyl carrier protein
MNNLGIPEKLQDILRSHLPYADSGDLAESDELASLGLDSMGMVRLLAAIEDSYDVELPDDILNEDTFATVGSLWRTLSVLVPSSDERIRTADADATR